MTLEARLRRALIGLYWVSHGPTAKIDANRVSGSKDRAVLPAGDGFPVYDEYRVRWERAVSERARLEVVEAAEEELERWLVAPDPPSGVEPERGSWAWKKRVANDPRPVAEVSRVFSVSRVTVYEYIRRYRDLKRAA